MKKYFNIALIGLIVGTAYFTNIFYQRNQALKKEQGLQYQLQFYQIKSNVNYKDENLTMLLASNDSDFKKGLWKILEEQHDDN